MNTTWSPGSSKFNFCPKFYCSRWYPSLRCGTGDILVNKKKVYKYNNIIISLNKK